MNKGKILRNILPVSISLEPALEAEHIRPRVPENKKRLLTVAALAVLIAILVSGVAKLLMYTINIITNLSFYGHFSAAAGNPSLNHLGIWMIFIPAIGGVIVGQMALHGSQAIRGHGIPEAMEQILVNKSKIKPTIVYLKPVSSAIAIGTGGPFGAEGPVIATGGALGSTIGQLFKISHNERKVLLAAGASAGMAAIFGSPIAAIFLAIELLLFEFSPRSIIPVALASITGAAGHQLLFGQGPVFPMAVIVAEPGNIAILWYSIMGIALGFFSIMATKFVFWAEDIFNKIPVHWAWYPAIGGLAAGVIGYLAPRTLGVGYYNITDILTGHLTIPLILSLSVLKFFSWSISLGSGTSGGTLAPLLTIGGATGLLFGLVIIHYFPNAGITLPMAALIGMSAMFAGASRALLTSIIFAIESTGQSNALLPLLAACSASYFISFFFMKNTIMTEKIARKGVRVPESYGPDMLEKIPVSMVASKDFPSFAEDTNVPDAEALLRKNGWNADCFIVTDAAGHYKGYLPAHDLLSAQTSGEESIGDLLSKEKNYAIDGREQLQAAVQEMLEKNTDALEVTLQDGAFAGLITYKTILAAYRIRLEEDKKSDPDISLKSESMKAFLKRYRT